MKSNSSLVRSLTFKDVLILAFSTMIGWGWVALTGNWVNQGGSFGAALAFAVGAVLCIFVGLTYCELTPALPYAGGELVFSYKAMGYNAAWFTGWMITFAYIGVAAWEGPALATAIDYIIPIPRYGFLWTVAGFDVYITWLILPVVVGSILTLVNLMGIKVSSIFQAIITIILAIGGIVYTFVGCLNGDIQNIFPMFTSENGFFAVVLAVPAMFVGFDVIPQAAEEMNLSLKKIPKAIITSICLAATWYIIIVLTSSVAAPSDVLGSEGLSVVNAITYATGNPIWGKFIVITAIMGILSSWNGFIIGATRVLYSMGRVHMLPKALGKMHKKYNSPVIAVLFVGIITVLTPLLGKNSLGWFVDASAFGTVVAYLMVAISFVILRIRYPEMHRPFKLKYGIPIGIIAIAVALFFIVLYLPVGSSSLNAIEWIIVGVWIAVGAVLFCFSLGSKTKEREYREKAMFGNIDLCVDQEVDIK